MRVAEKHQGDWIGPLAAGWRRRVAALAIPALLLLVIVLFYWKLTLSRQYSWLDSPDFAYQVLPWFQFQAGEWHAGRLPLWDPYNWGGQPLVGQAQPGAAYPLNWLLFLVPLRHGWMRMAALHWYYVLIHWMAALFCYWLCRDLGRSRGASFLAGLGFSLAGWFAATEWPQMINGAVWTPLIFLFLFRVLRGVRPLSNAVLAGTFLGVSLLSGHHQIPVFIGLACTGVWLWGLLREGRFHRELLVPAAAFAVFALLAGGLQTFPAWEYGKLAIRWVGSSHPVGWNDPVPFSVHAEFGLRPLSILGIVIPGFMRHADPYIGFVLASFAFLAVAVLWRDWQVRVMSAVALGALVFSLAAHGFFEGVVYALVPMVDKARNPSMAIFMFHFGLCVLFAFGIDSYIADEVWSRRLQAGLAAIGVAIFAFLFGTSLAVASPPKDLDMIALAGFSALLLAAVLYGWRRGRLTGRAAAGLVALLLLMEAGGTHGGFYWRNQDAPGSLLKNLSQHGDIAEFFRAQSAPVRAELGQESVPYNFGDWYGVDVLGGYLASLTTNIQSVAGSYHSRMLLAANYSVGDKPRYENAREVFSSRSGLKVFENPEAFPRAWSVHEVEALPSAAAINERVDKDSLVRLRRRAYVQGTSPAVSACTEPDRVQIVSRTANQAIIEAIMGCRGMVIAAEPYFPGWHATVDGRAAPVWEAYGFLRGVVVDRGSHRVVLKYRPMSVIAGGIATGLALLAALFCSLGAGRRERRNEA